MRLPDRFDLWVRRAKNTNDPARQIDLLFGSLLALEGWVFYGSDNQPLSLPIEDQLYLLVFSSVSQAEDLSEANGLRQPGEPLPVMTLPPKKAVAWILENKAFAGILVNPGEEGFILTRAQMEPFYQEWLERGGTERRGFWIPNLTDEEEDFWQEHGL